MTDELVEKRKPGRAPKWSNPDDLKAAIDRYYSDCAERGVPPTIPGLAGACGFVSRQSLIDYMKKGESFADIIKDAKRQIEQHRNEQMLTRETSVTGYIFDLKANFGYSDKQEIEINNPDGNMGTKVLTVLPDAPKSMEEWTRWYKELQRGDPEAIDVEPAKLVEKVESEWEMP